MAQRETLDAPWGAPTNLGTTINSTANDHCPLLTPDGHHLIFVSTRLVDGVNRSHELYISRRHDASDDLGWETPINLGPNINTPAIDFTPGFFEDDNGQQMLYFASDRPGGFGATDVYVSVGDDWQFGPAVHVPELSTASQDFFPMPRRDGLELFLTSDRTGSIPTSPTGPRSLDLWVSTRESTSEPWGPPANMGSPINTSAVEQRGAISFSRTILIFFSNRPGGLGMADLYQTTRTKITGQKP